MKSTKPRHNTISTYHLNSPKPHRGSGRRTSYQVPILDKDWGNGTYVLVQYWGKRGLRQEDMVEKATRAYEEDKGKLKRQRWCFEDLRIRNWDHVKRPDVEFLGEWVMEVQGI